MIKLETRQLFLMKRPGIDNRFSQFDQQENNDSYLIQCAIAMMVRNAFSPEDFSFIAKDLIRKLFFTSDSLASVRHLCVYFQEYFTKKEWKTVTARLFTNQKEYLAITEETRSNTDHLHALLHSGSRKATELQNIVTTFKDENGKKHRYTFKNLDPCYSVQITNDLLCILNTLTIFQHNGVRRFTELVRYVYSPTEPVYDSERETETATRWVENNQTKAADAREKIQEMKRANSGEHPTNQENNPATKTQGKDSLPKSSSHQKNQPSSIPIPPESDSSKKSDDGDTKRPDWKYRQLLQQGKKKQNQQNQQLSFSKKGKKKNRKRNRRK
ncbi:hypothetical protein [Enterococcus sp. AZ109]|uniref:hypothetical protein n=1 Tax=Enterococcus sp. AZ109 TaxID=2774634 RepID=UPI003F255CE3